MDIIRSVGIFILAGICEIGGGYLMWLTIREGKPAWYAVLGALILVLYGLVATFQSSGFGRVYAAYGGFFIVLSILWAYKFDNFQPDKYDLIGAAIVLIGVFVIYYMPRN
jgi:small multidrug resistance family-3 protein